MKTWIAVVSATAAGLCPVAAFVAARSSVVKHRLPRWYLLPFSFECWRRSRVYCWLGVRWFKYWLPWSDDRVIRRSGKHPLRQGERQAMIDKAFQNTILTVSRAPQHVM